MSIMREPCFDFLRTKKTLGYAVYCQLHSTDDVFGASITVRSQRDKFTVEEVKSTIAEFLEDFATRLDELTDSEFEGLLNCFDIKYLLTDFLVAKEI